ncbi:Chemotaxis protein CheA [Marinomonas aquimarina]|uniref:Chemotaxis protein CheA n=1 Tax=Marinomonas aquimarina TaxID=295068 RepID=A0A1A8TAV5_9GAMM|nr:Hpt domain-containing protein [Marinomonas aquimarina]SBS28678.1 Chemotaxis protein CheA [Marinomonas aquimarina]
MDNLSQFNEAFFEEAQEHLETMETLLLDYDVVEPDIEVLNSVFRAAHSIKGGSAIFGFTAMTGLTHVMENMLDRARNEELELTNELITVLLETVDVLKDILHNYRHDEEIDWDTIESSKARLESELAQAMNQQGSTQGAADAASQQTEEEDGFGFFDEPGDSGDDEGFGFFDEEIAASGESEDEQGFGFFDENIANDDEQDAGFGFFEDAPGISENEENEPSTTDEIEGFGLFDHSDEDSTEQVTSAEGDEQAPPAEAAKQEDNPEASAEKAPEAEGYGFFDEAMKARHEQDKIDNVKGYGIYPKEETAAAEVSSKTSRSTAKAPTKAGGDAKNTEASSIRVETVKIDKLVNLVGELVITQSMLNLIGNEVQESVAEKMMGALAELERNTREIQEAVMSVRMLPISFVFNRFPRLVRDLSVKMDKQIELVIEGASTEIDKNLVEKISDPLTH